MIIEYVPAPHRAWAYCHAAAYGVLAGLIVEGFI
jgi:hypothetical protein